MLLTGNLLLPKKTVPGWILIENQKIVDYGTNKPPGTPDLTTWLITPGITDIQINGAGGYETTTNPDNLHKIDKLLLKEGITTYLATIITTDPKTTKTTIKNIKNYKKQNQTPLAGIHLEGPYLSPQQPGMHNKALLQTPENPPNYMFDPTIKLITLAPELPGSINFIKKLTKNNIHTSLGHTNASPQIAQKAIEAGTTLTTHLFNAMTPFHHRNPGITGWALTHPTLTLSIIPDTNHLHPTTLNIINKLATKRIMLTSDLSSAALAAPGSYRQGQAIIIKNKTNQITNLQGNPVGGSTSLLRMLPTWTKATSEPFDQTLRKITYKPLETLHLPQPIKPGQPANILTWNDNLTLQHILWQGNILNPA